MTGAYERELREVLSGTEKGVNAVTKSCTPQEKERMSCVQERPFLVCLLYTSDAADEV